MLLNAFLIILLNFIAPVSSNRVNYSIIERSSLSLSGSSNVNKFECTTYDNFSNGFIVIHTEEEEETVKFNNAVLKINIKSFDCKNPLLTKDFYNTLNAKENPTIDVELLSAEPMGMSKILRSNKGKFKAEVAISLNGTSKLDQIIVNWEKTGFNTYRFIGEKKLLMSDFDIESPVSALGLIKVKDEINISFDLFIQANPKIF
jgi:hypothetical protein